MLDDATKIASLKLDNIQVSRGPLALYNKVTTSDESKVKSMLFSKAKPSTSKTDFNYIKLKSKVDVNKGTFYSIDVQSVVRYITYCSHFTTLKAFPAIEHNSYLSITSVIGYRLVIFSAQPFGLQCRREKSAHSLFFEDSARMSSFVNTLMNCKIPADLATELQQLAPVLYPLRPHLE